MSSDCSESGCLKPLHTRGYCTTHYRRYLRHGTIERLCLTDEEVLDVIPFGRFITIVKVAQELGQTRQGSAGRLLRLEQKGFVRLKAGGFVTRIHQRAREHAP